MKKIALLSYSPGNTDWFYPLVLCLGSRKHYLLFVFIFWFFKGYSQAPIDLSRPVGMTEGVAGSNGGGAAAYTIPIEVPAGVKGVQPKLSLTYSSQGAGNGFSGHGWSLSSISMITRSGKNVFHDNGVATPVQYTGSNDAFMLDGQRLMLISGTNGASGSVYGTEQEGFNTVEAIGGNGDSPDWFKVTTKDGTVLEYGNENSKLLTNSGAQTIFWALRRVTDASGNYMLYDYTIDNSNRFYYLSSIVYTGNSNTGSIPSYLINFYYSTKTDYMSSPVYMYGERVYSARILDRVDVCKIDYSTIRSYSLSYQYRHKKYFLTTVTESGANGTALNPISFTYGENTNSPDISISADQGNNLFTDQNAVGDFNGDGRQDVLTFGYSQYTSNNNSETYFKQYAIRDFDGSSVTQQYYYNIESDIPNTHVKLIAKESGQNPYAIMDFDGDGKDDVVLTKFNTIGYRFKGLNINYSRVRQGLNPGDKYVEYKKVAYDNIPTAGGYTFDMVKPGGSYFASGDFDGDGYGDYILILGVPCPVCGTDSYLGFWSTPAKGLYNLRISGLGVGISGGVGDYGVQRVAEAKALIPINFDGDAKTELLVVRDEGSYVISFARSGNSPTSTLLYSTADIKKNYRIFPGDFNGDGNTDLLVRGTGRYDQWKIFTSTGKVFNQTNFNFNQLVTLPADLTTYSNFLSVGDYDGDGKTDIWHSGDMDDGLCHHFIYYSNGTSFTAETFVTSPTQNTQSPAPVGDFNGDGKPDFLKINSSGSNSFYARYIMVKPFKEQNLLTGISNLGYLTNIDYGLLNNKDNSGIYSRTEGDYSASDQLQPTPHVPSYIVSAPPAYVVSQIKRPNGIGGQFTESFNYQDLIIHPSGRGFLGFKRADIINNDMGTTNRIWNAIDLNYSMLYPEISQTHLNDGGLSTRSRYTTSFKQVSASSTDNRRFFMKTDRVHTKNWLTNEGTEVLSTYDDYGNVTQMVTNSGTTNDFNITSVIETATASTVYGAYLNAPSPYPGFPITTTISKTRTGQPTVSKTTNYTYTTQGLQETVTDNAGTAIATTVTNTYNGFGLPLQITTSAPGVSTPVTEFVYDASGRYVLEKKLIGGGIMKKTSTTYDDRWGAPLTATSTDGLTTSYVYNEFGDLTQTNYPDGNVKNFTKGWFSIHGSLYYMKTATPAGHGYLDSYSFIDLLGREVYNETRWGVNVGTLVSTVRKYNGLGQLTEYTPPYDAFGGEPANTTVYTYDVYGRPQTTSNTTGTITTTYINSGGSTSIEQTTNAAGQVSSKTNDASGKVISSNDNGNTMSFTYDSWGNQLTASSGGQTFVTNVYDDYGRKTSTTDINTGTITYQYNSIGQIIQQTDENSNVQNMTYDIFGRAATTSGAQGTTTYTYFYDAGSGKSNDNPTQIVGFNGDVTAYTYDALQRLSSETITASGSSLTKTYTYDSRGNLATTTYPAGFTIRNEYDINSNALKAVYYEKGSTTKTLFYANVLNSRGVYTNYTKTSGRVSEVRYDFNKEVVDRYYTWYIQDLHLTYEANTHNLIGRNDNYKGISETFTYDANDRLTSSAVNGVQQFSINYDGTGQGKMLQKTDVGGYNYDVSKIHKLQSLSAIGSAPDPNLTMGPQTYNIAYTAFRMPQAITHSNGYQVNYSYGADRQRLTSELKYGGATIETRSYWGDVEGITKGGNSYEVYYINAGNGLNNIIVNQGGNINIYDVYTDHLGSIVFVVNGDDASWVAEQNFDAWGRKRNPNTWTHAGVPAVPDWLIRGFTGHEHIAELGLVNMNARMYDPTIGQMLAPDNYISMPLSPGGYNRFLYANGNPLKFIDPDGNHPIVVAAIIGAAVGAASYTASVALSPGGFNNWNWWGLAKSVGLGAVSGAATAGIGQIFTSSGVVAALGNTGTAFAQGGAHGLVQGSISSLTGGSFIEGFASGALGSLGASGFESLFPELARSAAGTIGFGALAGGVGAEATGGDFWRGAIMGGMVAGLNHYAHEVDKATLKKQILKDGKLTLSEANKWWNRGGGDPLTVDASKVDLNFLRTRLGQFPVGVVRGVQTFGNSSDGLVYGSIDVIYNGKEQFYILQDRYEFEMHSGSSFRVQARNFFTRIGNWHAGSGVPYSIYFNGLNTPKLPITNPYYPY